MRQHTADPADLLAVVSAIGHPVEEAFDPQRFLEEFSRRLEGLIPHDGAMIAYLDESVITALFARLTGSFAGTTADRSTLSAG